MSDLSHPLQETQEIITFITCETWIQEQALGLTYAWNNNAKIQATECMMSVLQQVAPCSPLIPVILSCYYSKVSRYIACGVTGVCLHLAPRL